MIDQMFSTNLRHGYTLEAIWWKSQYGPTLGILPGPGTIGSATKPLTTFHQAAKSLSPTAKNNIRILRSWAKSKGWEKLPNPHGKPEIWGTYENGKLEWKLKIKPVPSISQGLSDSIYLPRFDARLLSDPKGSGYINPFTGQIGGAKIGRHLLLDQNFF